MQNSGLEKYKGLIITLALFLLFFLGISYFNLYLARSLNTENDRLQVIRTLNHDIQNQNIDTTLRKAIKEKIKALKNGGEIGAVSLPKLSPTFNTQIFDKVLTSLKDNDDKELANHLKALIHQWDNVRNHKIQRFNLLQYSAIIFAILYFVGIVFQLIRNFKTIDTELDSVKDETENILSTVNEGLFLITDDFQIGSQQSKALKKMFGLTQDLEGNFLQFLEKYVSEKSLDIAKDFLGLLFGKRVKEKLIDDLNPLKKVQINIVRRDGSFDARYISFDFKRVIENKKIKYILSSVTDVTKEVLLEQELEETKEHSEAQIDLFMSVLHVPHDQLKLFMNGTSLGIKQANSILKESSDTDYKGKVDQIFRIVHKIKGDAMILNLHSFEMKLHEFEETMSELRKNPNLKGEDLLPLAIHLKGLIKHQGSFQGIFEKFEKNRNIVNEFANTDKQAQAQSSEFSPYSLMCNDIASQYGKKVVLFESGSLNLIDESMTKNKINDCIIQLLRNAVVHGIEKPENRINKGKLELGSIKLQISRDHHTIEIIVRDDGAGIDIDGIKAKALANGLISENQLKALPDSKLVNLIFHPSFSILDEADKNAGRGVGLNIVKKIVNDEGAKLAVKWKKDEYTVFKFIFKIAN